MELQDWPVYVSYGLSFLGIGSIFLYHKILANKSIQMKKKNAEFWFNQGLGQEKFIQELKKLEYQEGDEIYLEIAKENAKGDYGAIFRYPSLPSIDKFLSPIKYFKAKKRIKLKENASRERLNVLEKLTN